MKRRIDVNGRDFDVVEVLSLEQELYLAALIRRGSLDRIHFGGIVSLEDAAEYLMDAVEKSRLARNILSALIVPAGEPWSLEEAQKTAAFFKANAGSLDDNTAGNLSVILYQALFDRGVLHSQENIKETGR